MLNATILMAVWALLESCWASDPSQTDQPKPATEMAEQLPDRFELQDGDRAMFIGNTFFERNSAVGRLVMIDHGDATVNGQFVSGK